MAKTKMLNARKCETIKKPGLHHDGDGLYLQVSKTLSKSWIFRYRINGRERKMGLGSYPVVSLEKAREQLHKNRVLVNQGIDPVGQKIEAPKPMTFRDCALAYINAKQHEWKNPKHRQQWHNTLDQYAYPIIGDKPIKEVTLSDVLKVLSPIWLDKNETASRLRGRLENILNWAKVMKYRTGDNPAAWRGNLDALLSSPAKVQKPQSFRAMPYKDIAAFMAELKLEDSISARALEFLILTAARTKEVIGAQWSEIDDDVWKIPGERMKAGKPHIIPLCGRAQAILNSMPRVNEYIFPGRKNGISNAAMDKQLQVKMDKECTVHGFRSTFRDWAAECTHHSNIVCEMALAHTIRNAAEAAYRRGDLLEKRRKLMDDWESFLYPVSAEVIPIRKKG